MLASCQHRAFRLRALLVLALVASISGPTAAQTAGAPKEPDRALEDARLHYESGLKAYEAGDFELAYRHFEDGYRAQSRPGFLLNMAHAQRRLGNLRRARDLYRRYVLVEPDAPGADSVQKLVDDLDKAIAADERERPDAGADGPPDGGSSNLLPGNAGTAHASPNLIAVSPPPPAPPPVYKRWWFWAAAGVLAVGAGVAAALLARQPGTSYEGQGSLGTWKER